MKIVPPREMFRDGTAVGRCLGLLRASDMMRMLMMILMILVIRMKTILMIILMMTRLFRMKNGCKTVSKAPAILNDFWTRDRLFLVAACPRAQPFTFHCDATRVDD